MDVGTNSHYYKAWMQKGKNGKYAREMASSAPLYWGGQPFTGGNVYVGAIVCFLFLLGILLVRGPMKWGLALATVLSLLLALGSHVMPLTKFFVMYFPLYSKFRAVSSILVVAQVAMPLLGFLGLQAVLDGKVPQKKALQSLYIAAGITAGICLLFAIIGPSVFSFKASADASRTYLDDGLYQALLADRKALLIRDSLRSAGFILAAAALLFFYLRNKKGTLKKAWVVAAMGLLVVWDLWSVDRRYLNESNFVTRKEDAKEFEMMAWEKELKKDTSLYRVFNISTGLSPFSEARTSLYNKSVGGYSAVKLRRYQELIDQHLKAKDLPVLGMLNTKYVIVSGKDGEPMATEFPFALGNAWFVDKVILAKNDQVESDALMRIDLSNTAVVGKEFEEFIRPNSLVTDPKRSVSLVSHAPDFREYKCKSSVPATLVFSEVWYPHGWKAYIDGEPAPLFRANYILRAINVPRGTHTIRMVFDPDSVKKGNALAIPFVVLMYLALAAVVALPLVRRLSSSKRGRQDEADA
jgi:hypothetical protein